MGKRRANMVVEGGAGGEEGEGAQAETARLDGEQDDRHGLNQNQKKKRMTMKMKMKMMKKKTKTAKSKDADRREEVEEKEEEPKKEGAFLLGDPTFLDLGNGRLRCVETGHELLARDKESYGRTRSCRLSLIDAAVASKKPPLNMFEPHATFKSKLVCKLTGGLVNKSEEHIWKHINGKKFYKKLEQKETEKYANEESVEKDTKKLNKKTKSTTCKKDQKKESHENGSPIKKTNANSLDDEELDFWVPPIGSRWDCDDGTDRWNSGDEAEDGSGLDPTPEKDDHGTRDLTTRSKRKSIAVGPSSLSPRKKKSKKTHKKPPE